MSDFLKDHYDTEGPLGIPMKDRQAQALEPLLKTLPQEDAYKPGTLVVEKATTELLQGERADVSWISTEDLDRYKDIVISAGMDDSHFKLNPIVTLGHAYYMPPVGRSLWRKKVKDGALTGIKAKTQYPTHPSDWPEGSDWPPDCAFSLVQNGLLNGKSIGFLPLEVSYPTDEEREKNPALKKVWRIVKRWLLLEYACVYLPCQQNAVVEAVSKGLIIPEPFQKVMNLTLPSLPEAKAIEFTALDSIEQHIATRLASIDFDDLAKKTLQESYHRAQGRV